MSAPRLILFPGLGADARMFAELRSPGPQLLTPSLPVPQRGEGFSAYAERIAAELEIGPQDLVGGSSFGSLVASEIARRQPVRALILIGGALTPATLGALPRYCGWLLLCIPPTWLRSTLASEGTMRRLFAPAQPQHYALAAAMLRDTHPQLLRLGAAFIGRAKLGVAPPTVATFAIHGGRDPLMAPPPVAGCDVVADAGHGLAMTHAHRVNDFLHDVWRQLERRS